MGRPTECSMVRDLDELSQKRFDLVVVGGGIYGIFAAWEACRNGLEVCLLEKEDFMGATSSNSLRIIHGGLRYLQHLDIGRMRESIKERRFLMSLAPHSIQPMPFVIPTYGWGLRSPAILKAAMLLNDVVSVDRNRGIEGTNRIPAGRLISKADCLSKMPGIDTRNLAGGAVWHDALASNTESVALSILKSSWKHGARLANYVRVKSIIRDQAQVLGVQAECQLTGRSFSLHSSAVLNAAGPWVDEVLTQSGLSTSKAYFRGSKAFNLVTKPILKGHAAAIPFKSNFRESDAFLKKGVRHFFIIPWRGHSLIGTRHLPYAGTTADFRITPEDVKLFVEEINQAYPPAALEPTKIMRVFGGLVPGRTDDAANVQLQKHYQLIDHFAHHGVEGLVSIVGVKWTTARDVAERAIRLILRKLKRTSAVEQTKRESSRPKDALIENLCSSIEENGRDALLASLIAANPELGDTISPETSISKAEVICGIRFEMAQRLTDILFRRTTLGLCGKPHKQTVDNCLEMMSSELNWDSQRQKQESEIAEREFSKIQPA